MLGPAWEVRDLRDFPEAPEVEETGDTFLENATLKAVAISRLVPGLILADDSGLEVDALRGAPGVRSARFAGEKADDAANNAKLLAALEEIPDGKRTARFRCVMVAAEAGGVLAHFDGTVEGGINGAPRGTHGFGYDPLFVPEGFHRTFAELGPDTKNRMSHRARALQALREWLDRESP